MSIFATTVAKVLTLSADLFFDLMHAFHQSDGLCRSRWSGDAPTAPRAISVGGTLLSSLFSEATAAPLGRARFGGVAARYLQQNHPVGEERETEEPMMGSLWLMWMIFMFVFLVPSLGYGWGYRRWGLPYPRYIQRRRGQQAAATGGSTTFNHQAWGWGGDFVWMVMLIGVFWACAALWWR